VSATQRRLWLLAESRPGDPFYNVPFAFDLDGSLDRRRARGARSRTSSRDIRRCASPYGRPAATSSPSKTTAPSPSRPL